MTEKPCKSLTDLTKAKLIKPDETEALLNVEKTFSIAIPSHTVAKLHDSSALKKQFLPAVEELNPSPHAIDDPIGDKKHSPIKGIIHRHNDRCLFMPINICAVYCRFCFRRENIGANKGGLTPKELTDALHYIRQSLSIKEVILSGGDPLLLSPRKLKMLINELNTIRHVEIIRIHTKLPVVDPNKVTPQLITALQSEKPVYMVLHINHPDEFDATHISLYKKLTAAGIPLLSQSVLLKDINDNEQTLAKLMQLCVKHKIKPYYLHHPDKTKGTEHFHISIEKGQALVAYLRQHLSGLCQPTYVLDIPGGYGKVPLTPCYCKKTNDTYKIKDLNGTIHDYV